MPPGSGHASEYLPSPKGQGLCFGRFAILAHIDQDRQDYVSYKKVYLSINIDNFADFR